MLKKFVTVGNVLKWELGISSAFMTFFLISAKYILPNEGFNLLKFSISADVLHINR